MASTAAPPRIVLHDTFGACLIAVIVASALWGISIVQTWYYFVRFPEDSWYIKLLVGATVTFDTLHQVLISHMIYWYLVTNYANPVELPNMVWSILVEILFNGLIGLLVQGFMTYRVYRLSHKNRLITGFLTMLVFGLFCLTMTLTTLSLQLVTFADMRKLNDLSMSINALGAIVDVILAVALCYLLQLSRTGFRKTDSIINKLMLFALNTGLLTSICAVLSLATCIAYPTALIYATFYFCLGRLYSNSLLATLNSRHAIRGLGEDTEHLSISLGKVNTKGTQTLTSANNISIKIDTTKEFTRDHKESTLT